MINQVRLQEILKEYKKYFLSHWDKEKYNWEAVACFQQNWDIKAPDFADMLNRSLKKCYKMELKNIGIAIGHIKRYAQIEPEETRSMFHHLLYDEKIAVFERMTDFKNQYSDLVVKYEHKKPREKQDESLTSMYLWLCYPDTYYFYRLGTSWKIAEILMKDNPFELGAYENNIRYFTLLYDEINQSIKSDKELLPAVQPYLVQEGYIDPDWKILTVAIGLYMNRCYEA